MVVDSLPNADEVIQYGMPGSCPEAQWLRATDRSANNAGCISARERSGPVQRI